ncbi:MAG: cytochrome c biogenesis protein CcsA [Bacteroidota bacterium]|nr:cytochrome c biogenesis protein CcsA [Bacteroidota bacterium]
MIGSIIVKIAFSASLLSAILYFLNHRRFSSRVLLFARIAYHTAVVSIILIAVSLIYILMTHQFQFSYVWNYSSTDLPGPLLFSTFYAGQEGSFTLWALYTGVIGAVLLRYSAHKGYESEFMTIFSLILTFLLLMLIIKNPFTYIWDVFPKDLIHTGAIPAGDANVVWLDRAKGLWAQYPLEGRGLNPLLQNYWMVIHPPVLFLGFTSMSIPFAYAVAGMLKRDYVSWIRVSTPWTVFGAMVLGTGIVLGGYWAYETLGWGGYWGWDPVENSSLVPWLVCVASIHTMLSQRRSGSFIKTNFVLSLLCYILVLYSTFLTRSGVLGETSVHSFAEPGMWVYWMLLLIIVVFAAIGFGLFFARRKEMPRVPVEHSFFSREFALFLGASALVFASLFVVIGTSSPIITSIWKNKLSAVDTSYYVTTVLPMGVVIALLSGIGQLLWWKNSDKKSFWRSLRLPVLLAIAVGGISYAVGARSAAMVVFIFAAAFMLCANLLVGYRVMKGNPRMAGGAIAHIGIALMFLGFVASAKYDTKETVSLEQGKAVEALGYKMTYLGYRPTERGRFAFDVEVEKGRRRFVVSPVMFSGRDNEGMIRNPDIINLLTKDFYVSPLSLDQPDGGQGTEVTLYQGKPQRIDGITVEYIGYTFSTSPEFGNVVKVNLNVTHDGKKERVVPAMHNNRGQIQFIPASLSHSGIQITLKSVRPAQEGEHNSTATVAIVDPGGKPQKKKNDVLVVEATIKPYINLVWLGVFILIGGFLITIARRREEARRDSTMSE